MPALEALGHADLREAIRVYRDALRDHRPSLNRLNVYPVPDGDTGTNMALTLESVAAELDGADDMATTCKGVSHGSLMGARGNSGVILSQILRGMAGVFQGADPADGEAVARAFEEASAAAYQAVARPVEGTMLTVLREASEAARAACGEGGREASLCAVLEAAASAARASVARTPELLPVLAEAGVVDAGGAGVALLFDALLTVVDGRPVPAPESIAEYGSQPAVAVPSGASTPGAGDHGPDRGPDHGPDHEGDEGDVGDLRYEVMFFLEADDQAVAGFKEAWSQVGDSIVVVGGDGLWNCHIHTDDIGAAVEAAIEAGRPRQLRVTDLREQMEEIAAAGPPAPTGVVAVGRGPGVVGLLRSLGANQVVPGGRGLNPSTAEIVAAVERVPATTVIVLPNDKNVIGVAEQAAGVATRPVLVVPSMCVPEGVAALVGFDASRDGEANLKAMSSAAGEVVWGEIVTAVRAASTPAGPAAAGDTLGLIGGEIAVVAPDTETALRQVVERIIDDSHELVTVLTGADASPAVTGHLTSWLAENRPHVTVEVHDGGQPVSPYLVWVE